MSLIECEVCSKPFKQHLLEKCCSIHCKMVYLGYTNYAKKYMKKLTKLTKKQLVLIDLIDEGIVNRKEILNKMNMRRCDLTRVIDALLMRKNIPFDKKRILSDMKLEK